MDRAYSPVMVPKVIQGCESIKWINRATNSIKGKNIYVCTFSFFNEIVGMRLTIKNATVNIKMLQNVFDRKINSLAGKSNVMSMGVIAKAAAAGAGTPTK